MDNARFISILNRALGESGLDPTAPASPDDPRAVAAWAGFLRQCVASGVSIADARWGQLEVRTDGSAHTLVLAAVSDPAEAGESEDFTLGLSLLMSMLGRGSDRELS